MGVQEIREMQKNPINVIKGYDPSETVGWGFLDEMSLVELKAKQEEIRMEQEKQRNDLNQKILQEKQSKKEEMERKIEKLKNNRAIVAETHQVAIEQKKRIIQEEEIKRAD